MLRNLLPGPLESTAVPEPPIDPLTLNIKAFGYDLARQLAASLPVREPGGPEPAPFGLGSKPSTQADMESDWVGYWCAQLKIPVIFHRKLWEFAYLLQILHEHGRLVPGMRGLGFGCGEEPIPSYLASRGIDVTVTDLEPAASAAAGWSLTRQHTSVIDKAHHPHLVDRAAFDRHVGLQFVDMNAIPPSLSGYDFCWSICAFEHLGSIENGLAFVERSLGTLKSGGVAVHTTEFNFLSEETLETGGTVLYQRRHFEALAQLLTEAGHTVLPLDFDVGAKPLDRFIDMPPYPHDWSEPMQAYMGQAAHLKLMIDRFACTCYGLAVVKG